MKQQGSTFKSGECAIFLPSFSTSPCKKNAAPDVLSAGMVEY